MIRVTIRYNNSKSFSSLSIKGHAGSGPYGHDLVCAAVSGVTLGGINNLSDNNYTIEMNEEKGNVELKHLGNISVHDEIVIETIITQLKSIELSYPKNIKISYEQ